MAIAFFCVQDDSNRIILCCVYVWRDWGAQPIQCVCMCRGRRGVTHVVPYFCSPVHITVCQLPWLWKSPFESLFPLIAAHWFVLPSVVEAVTPGSLKRSSVLPTCVCSTHLTWPGFLPPSFPCSSNLSNPALLDYGECVTSLALLLKEEGLPAWTEK
jgi:hypothetical protein